MPVSTTGPTEVRTTLDAMGLEWNPLPPGRIEQLFGKTTVHERPAAFQSPDGIWYVVLRGVLDDPGSSEETLWWSLCRIEAGESVELARDYGVEEVDGDVVEVSWDGLFPRDWVEAFVEGRVDWIRLSVTEVMENFGDTVRLEQPQGWRHRDGRWCLVLVGEIDEETGEEEYAWSLVEESCGEYNEVAVCHPGNGFGADDAAGRDVEAPSEAKPASGPQEIQAKDGAEEEPSIGDFLDGWWEEPPFAWGERTFRRILETEDAE